MKGKTRSTQQKFEELLAKGCEDRDYELVIDYKFANDGTYRIQPLDKIQSKVVIKFSWQDDYFGLTATPEVLGLKGYNQGYEVQASLDAILKFLEVG